MEGRNCPNCGAPLEAETNKCPYCGTSYLDICGLKLDGKTPIVLKYEWEYQGRKMVLSALAVATAEHSMTTTYDTTDVYNEKNQYVIHFNSCLSTDLELHFHIIPNDKNQLMTLTVEE